MWDQRLGMLGSCLLLAAACSFLEAAPPAAAGKSSPEDMAAERDARALAARIDKHLARRWAADKVEPAPLADDAEFLRRVYLDLAGRIPSVAEAHEFLGDKSPDKRARLIERLLSSPGYVNHFTHLWRTLLLPEADTTFIGRFLVPGLEAWLSKRLAANAGYDQMVREILTAPLTENALEALDPFRGGQEPNPLGFYVAKDVKPENLGASTARVFLGMRLECAQCHDHPFAKWSREQFWQYAAFFAGVRPRPQEEVTIPRGELLDRRELIVGSGELVVQPVFLDGTEPKFQYKVSSRTTLADWITSPGNPYFARATVNRLWAHFFGLGLTEPVDDMEGSETTANHPELLDDLAREFAAHKFDLKFVIRAIVNSEAYQRSSANTHPSQKEPHLFARMALKGLTGEQLFDSLVQATGYREPPRPDDLRFLFLYNNDSPRAKFLQKFANRTDRPTETQTSILQALALMNNKFIADATSLERSETLAAVAETPFLSTAERIETLYLATVSRKPSPEETERLVKYVDGRGPEGSRKALTDVFWALLNSSEFILNH